MNNKQIISHPSYHVEHYIIPAIIHDLPAVDREREEIYKFTPFEKQLESNKRFMAYGREKKDKE